MIKTGKESSQGPSVIVMGKKGQLYKCRVKVSSSSTAQAYIHTLCNDIKVVCLSIRKRKKRKTLVMVHYIIKEKEYTYGHVLPQLVSKILSNLHLSLFYFLKLFHF